MDNISIRVATEADLPTIDRLLRALVEHLDANDRYSGDLAAIRRYGFGESALFHVLLAEREQQSLGLCIYYPEFSSWRCCPGVFVLDLFVAADCRGSGLGARLLAETLRRAAAQWDAVYLKLAVHRDNHAAQGFYRQLGFLPDTENECLLLSEQECIRLRARE